MHLYIGINMNKRRIDMFINIFERACIWSQFPLLYHILVVFPALTMSFPVPPKILVLIVVSLFQTGGCWSGYYSNRGTGILYCVENLCLM